MAPLYPMTRENQDKKCLQFSKGKTLLRNIVLGQLKVVVRYHSGGSMKLNACILLLALMVYL
jgi:hypothetical protein